MPETTSEIVPAVNRRGRIVFAILFGILTHATFACSVGVMVKGLYYGLATGIGRFHGWPAFGANAILLAQFPLLHSYFLTAGGRKLMAKLAPAEIGKDLVPTTFVLIASLQLLLVFGLWSPSGLTLYTAHGATLWLSCALFIASWLFLLKALADAGLGLQTGFAGWLSVVRGKPLEYGPFPTRGLFRFSRHPVYLGFALVLWTAPIHTVDGAALAVLWTIYCLIAPRRKERRYLSWYGEPYARYRASVPYFLPRLRPGS
jgi:protein-S-isoprenylcysteine O-methyltransferase Ste14